MRYLRLTFALENDQTADLAAARTSRLCTEYGALGITRWHAKHEIESVPA